MIEKVLGKITSAYYGLGGYQDVQLGLSVSLEGEVVVLQILVDSGRINPANTLSGLWRIRSNIMVK